MVDPSLLWQAIEFPVLYTAETFDTVGMLNGDVSLFDLIFDGVIVVDVDGVNNFI